MEAAKWHVCPASSLCNSVGRFLTPPPLCTVYADLMVSRRLAPPLAQPVQHLEMAGRHTMCGAPTATTCDGSMLCCIRSAAGAAPAPLLHTPRPPPDVTFHPRFTPRMVSMAGGSLGAFRGKGGGGLGESARHQTGWAGVVWGRSGGTGLHSERGAGAASCSARPAGGGSAPTPEPACWA